MPREPQEEPAKEGRTWTETIEISGGELVDRVKNLIDEGNVRRLIIRRPDDSILLEIPLTAGAAVGAAVTLMLPILVALGALAALLGRIKVEIVRTTGDDG